MRVAFDATALTSPAGGVRRYVHELFSAMRRVAPEVTLVGVGGPAAELRKLGVSAQPAGPSLPTNLGWSISGLPVGVARAACDVFHAPAYTAPLWGARPLVVTLHDVSYARHPEWYPHRLGPARLAFYARSARRADAVLTDSDFSKSEIVAAYGIAGERIHVVPLAASDRFTPDPGVARERFVLHVGDLHPRRNLRMLLGVILELRRAESSCAGVQLVLAGVDRGSLTELRAQATSAGDAGALHYVGTPDDTELAGLYRRAGAFAYPSRYEGFGLPVLEAMACGAPVVASSVAAVPEVVGKGGSVVDPDDERGWHQALRRVLIDVDAACAASAAGIERAARFSWDRTARQTVEVYRRVHAASR